MDLEDLKFNRNEFKILLSFNSEFSHGVLSKILVNRPKMNFPELACTNKKIALEEKTTLTGFLLKVQKAGSNNVEDDLSIENINQKKNKQRLSRFLKNNNRKLKSEVDIFTVPFRYDYSAGSEDSVIFLEKYSESKSEEFISSNWKHLIAFKWKAIKIINILIALLFFCFLIFAMLTIVFEEKNDDYDYYLLAFTIVFIVIEFIQLMAYLVYNFKLYVLEVWNFVDWVMFAANLIYPLTLQSEHHRETKTNKLLGMVIMMLMFYRGFSYLRIFDYFTSLVGMINTIISISLYCS